MTKVIVFDMDGTLADFFNVKGWLDYLYAENTLPYEIAEPLYDMAELREILNALKIKGYLVAVTSWLSKGSTKDFENATRKAKIEWLNKYGFPYDELHLVKYGTTKANCTRHHKGYQILVDDNEKIRKGWNLGDTINANENIIPKLKELMSR